jgi:hypothetical protein
MPEDMMHTSDGTPSSEEEVCSSMCSTRPPSQSSIRSKRSQHQVPNFDSMAIDAASASGLANPVHPDSGDLFQYLPPSASHQYNFQHRPSMDHHMLDSSNFSPINLSTLSEPMLTPRPEYMPGPILDNSFPLHASSLPNNWLQGQNSSHSMNGFPFPESFDISPLHNGGLERQYQPPQNPSRKTTIVLEDIEETTLSKVMSILIQEKAKVRMETEHSDRTSGS